MITKERFEMLMKAQKKGADLAPRDFTAIAEYEQNLPSPKLTVATKPPKSLERNFPISSR